MSPSGVGSHARRARSAEHAHVLHAHGLGQVDEAASLFEVLLARGGALTGQPGLFDLRPSDSGTCLQRSDCGRRSSAAASKIPRSRLSPARWRSDGRRAADQVAPRSPVQIQFVDYSASTDRGCAEGSRCPEQRLGRDTNAHSSGLTAGWANSSSAKSTLTASDLTMARQVPSALETQSG